jgi:hypothetical protein
MLLITNFVELRVVAGRSRTRVGRPPYVFGLPMLIHKCHVMPMPRCVVALISPFQNGMVMECTSTAWMRHGMCETNTAQLCKSNGKDTVSTLSGTAWLGNGMVRVN